jgi:hypothetical protein
VDEEVGGDDEVAKWKGAGGELCCEEGNDAVLDGCDRLQAPNRVIGDPVTPACHACPVWGSIFNVQSSPAVWLLPMPGKAGSPSCQATEIPLPGRPIFPSLCIYHIHIHIQYPYPYPYPYPYLYTMHHHPQAKDQSKATKNHMHSQLLDTLLTSIREEENAMSREFLHTK